MKEKYIWGCVIGAFILGALTLLRFKFGNGANTAIASFSLTSAIIFAAYYIQTALTRRTAKNKRS